MLASSNRTVLYNNNNKPLRLLLIRFSHRNNNNRLLSSYCNDYQVLTNQQQPGIFVSTRTKTPTIFDMTTTRMLSSSSTTSMLSPFDPKNIKPKDDTTTSEETVTTTSESAATTTKTKKKRHIFVPRVAAVQLTDHARTYFKELLTNPIRSDIIGIMLHYEQSISGEPRMVFTFKFVTKNDINIDDDEGVSLQMISITDPNTNEVIKTIPKSPIDSKYDGLPKLYIHHNAFLKVLGATIDIDPETNTPILYDKEGNRMDPNA